MCSESHRDVFNPLYDTLLQMNCTACKAVGLAKFHSSVWNTTSFGSQIWSNNNIWVTFKTLHDLVVIRVRFVNQDLYHKMLFLKNKKKIQKKRSEFRNIQLYYQIMEYIIMKSTAISCMKACQVHSCIVQVRE